MGTHDDLLSRVRAAIATHSLFSPGEKVVVGVSGGPDSLALLHLLCALRQELELTLIVAHLDHQLRGAESAAEARWVQALAKDWGLEAAIGALDVAVQARENRMSLEEAGRVARYAFLASVAQQRGAQTIAVAHNADDQAETVLMHFIRGSGLAGLRGMRFKGPAPLTGQPGEQREGEPVPASFPPLTLVRPLLGITRAEIEAYCAAHGLEPRRDRSNEDTTLFRNRLRREVLPYLETLNPNLRETLRRTALSIADDYEWLRMQVDHLMAHLARAQGEGLVFARAGWAALHPALQRSTLREAVRLLRRSARNVNWEHIEQARRVALEGETGAKATLPLALELTVGYQEFTIAPVGAQPEAAGLPLLYADRVPLRTRGETYLPAIAWTVRIDEVEPGAIPPAPPGPWTVYVDPDALEGDLYLRTRQPGDRFQPAGMGGHSKSLHEFLIDEKVPQAWRDRLPLLCDQTKIVWVCGRRLDERAAVRPGAQRALRIQFVAHLYRDHRLEAAESA